MQCARISVEALRATLNKMDASSSIGVDGWKVAEARAMPDAWLLRLSELFEVIERNGTWPEALSMGLISPIPKEEGLGASHTRPITVMSVIYRVWAATRVRELIEWQQAWISDRLYSYRPERGCEDAWWTTALDIEHSLLKGHAIAGLSLDWSKAFDRIPHEILLALAKHVGVDAGGSQGSLGHVLWSAEAL